MSPRFIQLLTFVVIGAVASSCGATPIATPASGSTASSSNLPAVATVRPPAVDPEIAANLVLNNESFELQAPPSDVAISASRAVEIVASQTRGPIRKAEVLFGVLHANLGALQSPRAWLVLLVGPGFVDAGATGTPQPPSSAASAAQAANLYNVWAFVDAQNGRILISAGSGPPP